LEITDEPIFRPAFEPGVSAAADAIGLFGLSEPLVERHNELLALDKIRVSRVAAFEGHDCGKEGS
jgi:hypothetical protein